jgi:hypothetical protein
VLVYGTSLDGIYGWRDRRKTSPLYVASFVIVAGHSVYDDGLAAFNLGGLPIIAMAVGTIPVLYYEVLSYNNTKLQIKKPDGRHRIQL